MRLFSYLLIFFTLANFQSATAQNRYDIAMNQFVDQLMGKMTLEEKIGQMNLSVAGDITTGAMTSSDIRSKI